MSQKAPGDSGSVTDPHAEREREHYDSPVASREHLSTLLVSEKAPLNFEKLVERLGYADDEARLEGLRRRLGAMLRDGQLIQNRRGGYMPVDDDALIAGRIHAHSDGYGFLRADDGESDIYLNARQMRQVLHEDRVVVCITGHDRRGRREGRIVDIVERANRHLVGRVTVEQGVALVSPDNRRIHQDVVITPHEQGGAADGDMVVVEILEQPTRRHPPVGRIVEILGEHLEAGMEIDVALRSHDIPHEWPDEAVSQAAAFASEVTEGDRTDRYDIRDLPLVTIDGVDARDFDDAVYCEATDEGWRLLVAIADVAHYVEPGSSLDEEARTRGTSVYFPGRVVPMLPEVLSNGLCSLNPEVDRLCLLCEMTLDDDAGLVDARFHNAVMRSHARLNYDQAHEILSDHKSGLRRKFDHVVPHLEDLHELYELLAVARTRRGAIDFESNETRIVFDDNRKIRELLPVVRNDAHRLIEEFMILANIAAAQFLDSSRVPGLYRVHHGPKADRLEDLRAFLALRGLELGGGSDPSTVDFADLLREIEDRSDQSVIQTVLLRSMQQAVYQPRNEGHFGLALDSYAHFTSPIRRYPDLLVHRAIKHMLGDGAAADYPYPREQMQVLGESCSMTERRAEEATRDVVAWLKCEYMRDHIGSEFSGVISAVTAFGLFVELVDIHVEGLIHVTNLARDYYRFDQAAQALVGEAGGRSYRLGDSLVVAVVAVNLEERKIDFAEVESPGKQPLGRQAPPSDGGRPAGKRRGNARRRRGAQPGAAAAPAGGNSDRAEHGVEIQPGKPARKRRGKKRRQRKSGNPASGDQAQGIPAPDNIGNMVSAGEAAVGSLRAGKRGAEAKRSTAKTVGKRKKRGRQRARDGQTGNVQNGNASRRKRGGKAARRVGVMDVSFPEARPVDERDEWLVAPRNNAKTKVLVKRSRKRFSIDPNDAAASNGAGEPGPSSDTDGTSSKRLSLNTSASRRSSAGQASTLASGNSAPPEEAGTPAVGLRTAERGGKERGAAKKTAARKQTAVRKKSALRKKTAVRKKTPGKKSALGKKANEARSSASVSSPPGAE